MPLPYIRPLVIALFRHNDTLLVSEGYDHLKQQSFYRPLGGMIEFGEHSAAALHREIHEELGLEITDLRYLFTLENVFTYNGQPGHEIVLVYDAAFVNPAVYQLPWLDGYETDGANLVAFRATWHPLTFFEGAAAPPLYPDGLLQHLRRSPAA